ncbi:TIGR02921 family PEP-CTERM protein [Hahella sp. NBU794]|uniref:TIGR02921 family PEP-CTERM protein n=1 Tax=Hahella sp. NBU794 TaxID=3422590 RepID=UPI003D6ED709
MENKKLPVWIAVCCYLLFWFWNLTYAVLAGVLIIPHFTMPAITGAVIGLHSGFTALFATLLVAIPALCIGLGFTRFRKNPTALIKLFYGVEMPIIFIMLSTMFLLRELNPGVTHVLINILVALFAYLACLWGGLHTRFPMWLRLSLAMTMLLTGLYCALLLAPFFIPATAGFFELLGEIKLSHLGDIFNYLLFLVALICGLSTCVVFLALPFVLIFLYIREFLREWRIADASLGRAKASAITAGILGVNAILFAVLNQQPQQETFERMAFLDQQFRLGETIPSIPREKHDALRKGLINAYLAPYRYLSTTERNSAVYNAYLGAFDDADHALAKVSQAVFDFLATPFLYDGAYFHEDKERAARYYQKFFDQPIEKGEPEAILNALKATFDQGSPAAGLVDVLNRHVLVTNIAITVEPQDDSARIRIVQTLENQTYNNHEVTFHFSLPEEAALTGLWLSDDATDLDKFVYAVAPRGAAQQVYNDEVSRRIDPSLLEQVGPRQYRLRAFPVPPRSAKYNRSMGLRLGTDYEVKPMYLTVEYKTTLDDQDAWPLPQLLEKRNAYWSDQTQRTLNGQPVRTEEDVWLPTTAPVSAVVPRKQHDAVVAGQRVRAVPRTGADAQWDIQASKTPYAVLIDGSYSMGEQTENVAAALKQLQQLDIAHEIFLCHTRCQPMKNLPAAEEFYGDSLPMNQLADWRRNAKQNYEAVMLLTDAGSYEQESQVSFKATQMPPVWLVHLGGALAYAYHDQTLDLLKQSHGGVTQSLQEAIVAHQFRQGRAEDGLFAITPHYLWYMDENTSAEAEKNSAQSGEDFFSAIAARRWLEYLAQTRDTSDVQVLDQLHAIAKAEHMVTDYSSMIVLVEERQKKALEEAEQKADRFDREVETGQEAFSAPMDMFSASPVPEPEEWLLLGLAGLMLAFAALHRRRQFTLQPASL